MEDSCTYEPYIIRVYPNKINPELSQIEWRNLEGKLHRKDGPAVICGGNKYWYVNGLRHREDGPAMEYGHGYQAWYYEDKLHRTDGPAIIYPSGKHEYFIHGIPLTKKEFDKRPSSSCEGKVVEIEGKKYQLKLV